jgi:hypothetical protein
MSDPADGPPEGAIDETVAAPARRTAAEPADVPPESMADDEPPDTPYQPPVSHLLELGEKYARAREWPDYVAEFGLGPDDIPELIRMAEDIDLHWAESDSSEVWAPVHAWRALGQLRAEAAVEPLLALLDPLEDSDWLHEEVPIVLGMIGQPALPAVAAYLRETSHEERSEISAARAIKEIGQRHPAARDEAVRALMKKLEWYPRNSYGLNGFLISDLTDLHATEAAPLMERAFAADEVDLFVMGDWEDAQIELGLLEERLTERQSLLPWFDPELLRRTVGDAGPRAGANRGLAPNEPGCEL